MKRAIVIIGLLVLIISFFGLILYPSYLSVVTACYGNEVISKTNYSIAGFTTLNVSSGEITVVLYSNDTSILKHELVHVKQAQQGRLFGCNRIPLMYLCEMEAYTMQRLPNFIYKKIYGEF